MLNWKILTSRDYDIVSSIKLYVSAQQGFECLTDIH